jgi:Tfp pilus assembly protein PilE
MIISATIEIERMRGLKKIVHDEKKSKLDVKSGFTMVELSLSLVFIAILSISVVLVMASAISSYRRSITLSKVESVGSNLVRDIKASIQSSSANSLDLLCYDAFSDSVRTACVNDGGRNFSFVTRYANVKIKESNIELGQVPVFGAMCTGSYTYVWNSGYFFDPSYSIVDNDAPVQSASLTYMQDGVTKKISNFKLVKIKDENRKVCESAMRYDKQSTDNPPLENRYTIAGPGVSGIDSEFNMAIMAATSENPVRYLQNDNDNDNDAGDGGNELKDTNNLAIYDMSISVAEQSGMSRSAYNYGSFILGTVQGGININASGNLCAAPEGYNKSVENIDYCAINKFNFAALAAGG